MDEGWVGRNLGQNCSVMHPLCRLFQPQLQVKTLKDRLEEELLGLFAPVWDVAAGDASLHLALFAVACFCSRPIEVCSQACCSLLQLSRL